MGALFSLFCPRASYTALREEGAGAVALPVGSVGAHAHAEAPACAVVGEPLPGTLLVGVLDEQQGPECLAFAASHLQETVAALLQAMADPSQLDMLDTLAKAFVRVDRELEQAGLGRDCGVSAAACLVRAANDGRRMLYTANVGDCRAVVNSSGTAFRLSRDHDSGSADETARVRASGGQLPAGQRATRALGHSQLKHVVTSSPHTSQTALQPTDSRLLLASRAVWETLEDQEAVDFVEESVLAGASAKQAAGELVREAVRRGAPSSGRTTAVVVFLRPSEPLPPRV